jgi:hypothetical protein
MSDLGRFVSEDNRKPIERLNRRALYDVADEFGLQYPADCPKIALIPIMEGAGIDVTKSTVVNWQTYRSKDSHGRVFEETYPKRPEHHSLGKNINYDKLIRDRAKEQQEAADTISSLTKRLDEIEKKQGPSFPLHKLLPWQLQHLAKDAGIEYKGLSKEELIAALED